MSVKKFKFVSPGIFINEIDNSQLTKQGADIGPVIIGRTLRGPAMRPTQIESFADFIETFGEPVAGGVAGDVWRDGNRIGPTYAAYAAQAYLRNASPITFVRLLGEGHADASATARPPGWEVSTAATTWTGSGASAGAPGAYGLYILNGADLGGAGRCFKASLAAILYCKKGAVSLIGRSLGGDSTTDRTAGGSLVDSLGIWVRSDGADNQFKLKVRNPNNPFSASALVQSTNTESVAFNFSKTSRLYIRKVLNTNPTLCNDQITEAAAQKSYFLGPTFDRFLAEQQDGLSLTAANTDATAGQYACLMPLNSKAPDFTSGMSPAKTPWIISQHNGTPTSCNFRSSAMLRGATSTADLGIEKLFRFSSLYSGSWESKNLKISIYDIKAPTDEYNPYGSFSVMIRKAGDMDSSPQIVERYSSCNLNPASPDFIARKIGDMNSVWDDDERRYVNHGLYENQSRFVRVVLATAVEAGAADPRLLPYGFLGPARHAAIFSGTDASGDEHAMQVQDPSPTVEDTAADTFFADPASVYVGADPDNIVEAGGGHAAMTLTDIDADGTYLLWTAAANKIYISPAIASDAGNANQAALLMHPRLGMRENSKSSILSTPTDCFFGVDTNEYGSDVLYDSSYGDMVGWSTLGAQATTADASSIGTVGATSLEHQFIFSLDDVRYSPGTALGSRVSVGAGGSNGVSSPPKNFEWVAGCHAAVSTNDDDAAVAGEVPAGHCSLTAYAAASGASQGIRNPYAVLEAGCDRFTLPLCGGTDGIDIFEANPFQYSKSHDNTNLPDSGNSVLDHYALNSVKKAIDTVADPEVVEYNLLTAPGIVHPSLTAHMVSTCEARGDALAIIDIEDDYTPSNILGASDEAARMPNVDNAIAAMRIRGLNSSYGCCFFPWVQISDSMSGRVLWAPPSVAALGTMASSSRKSELWFAPAGFTRGGLTNGAAGIPVSSVRLRLNSKERDKLYEANINPIAQFPAEGIVIFGQKTLQITPSALDRINVRRLMIYLKKQISRMAKTVLFDQNVKQTWARFVSQADPFLASVKGRFGLTEYKIILDETTTTPELIDRNIMYAKILLKPAKAIEYIAIDFVITDSGASFDD